MKKTTDYILGFICIATAFGLIIVVALVDKYIGQLSLGLHMVLGFLSGVLMGIGLMFYR